MAQASSDRSTQTYNPPRIPEYLKNVHDLKPIVGIPSDDEVMGIHAVIRAAYNVSHVPGMFDPVLSMRLSQHLFEVQMARYRDKYPFGMFSGDTVYTPPALPSHVPVTLQPVVGAPSDEEMQDVQVALRAYEHFATVPSMFDPRVSMELSQHLCNLQIARYMQHVALGQTGVQRGQSHSNDNESTTPSGSSSRVREPLESTRDVLDAEPADMPAEANIDTATDRVEPRHPPIQTISTTAEDQTYLALKESNRLLEMIMDTMENVNRVLIGTQRSFVRGARLSYDMGGSLKYATVGRYEMVNDRGERPTDYGLPLVARNGSYQWNYSLNDQQLAQYLRFYGIGSELLETGDVPVLKDGKRNDAEAALLKYLD